MPEPVHVFSVWFEQVTAAQEEMGLASVRITTPFGHFREDATCDERGFERALRIARRLQVPLQVAYGLMPRFGKGWVPEGKERRPLDERLSDVIRAAVAAEGARALDDEEDRAALAATVLEAVLGEL